MILCQPSKNKSICFLLYIFPFRGAGTGATACPGGHREITLEKSNTHFTHTYTLRGNQESPMNRNVLRRGEGSMILSWRNLLTVYVNTHSRGSWLSEEELEVAYFCTLLKKPMKGKNHSFNLNLSVTDALCCRAELLGSAALWWKEMRNCS